MRALPVWKRCLVMRRLAATAPVRFSTRPMSASSGLPCKSSSTVTVPTVAAGVWPCSGVIPVRVKVSLQRQAGIHLLQRLVAEAVPTFASVAADAAPQHTQTARHVYLVLSTQKSAEDVGGWQHKHLLGLGVAVTYDTREGRYNVYTAETVAALLASLREADLVIGFNTRDFDYQVLQPYTDVPLATLPTLAVLDEVQRTLGFRLSLRHLVKETLGLERPDDSLRTLQWYQEGERERIVQQCRRDLELLRELVRYGTGTGTVFYRDQAGVRTAVPVHWQRFHQYG